MYHAVFMMFLNPSEAARFIEKRYSEKSGLIVTIISSTLFLLLVGVLSKLLYELLNNLPSSELNAISNNTEKQFLISLVFILVSTPVISWVFYRLFPVLLHRFVLPFGGSGTENHLRIVIGWGQIIVTVIMFLIILIMTGTKAAVYNYSDLFLPEPTTPAILMYEFSALLLTGILAYYGAVIYTALVATVENVSWWRAFGALCFASVLPCTLLVLFFIWIQNFIAMFF